MTCGCGCGQITSRASRNKRGYKKGEYLRFIRGHNSKNYTKEGYKRCLGCNQEKPFEGFYKSKRDGLVSPCKECMRKNSQQWYHKYIEKNRIAARERATKRDLASKREYNRKYWQRTDYFRKRYANDPNFRAKALDHGHQRRAIKKGTDKATVAFIRNIKLSLCTYCGNPADVADHIVPLARGGIHHWSNMTPACNPCNWSKNRKTYEEYLEWLH